jgi:hypothetical protein
MAQQIVRKSAEELFAETLRSRGYTPRETRQIIDTLEKLRGDRGILTHHVLDACTRMAGSRFTDDVWRMMERWNRVSPRTTSLSQITSEQASEISASANGPASTTLVPRLASSIAFLPLPGGGMIGIREMEMLWRLYRVLGQREDQAKPTPRPPFAVPMRRRQEPSEEGWRS